MDPKQWKFPAPTLVVGGAAGVLYGMINGNDVVFLAGLCFLVLGYLIVRKKLKEKD